MGKQDEEENGTLIEFPGDQIRMPTQRLPDTLGRVDDDHPLRKSISFLILLLAVILVGVLIFAFSGGTFPGQDDADSSQAPVVETYRENGNITYQDEIIDGWFVDPERQHFMDSNGVRYTYVDPHDRGGRVVAGHWRVME